MTTNNIKEEIGDILIELTDKTWFDHSGEALEAFTVAKNRILSSLDKYANAKLEEAVGEIKKTWNYPCHCLIKNEFCTHDYSQMELALQIINNLKTN